MVSPPLLSTETLKRGDVVLIATQLNDRHRRGEKFWWKRFAAVLSVENAHFITTLTLRMTIDLDKDKRLIDLSADVVKFVPNEEWPQGVSAMYAKALAKGLIRLD